VCVQKLKYVTFSSAFSSRYAKTRTSNFRRVVRQHNESMMESIIWVLLKIYLAFQQCKNLENPLRIDKVIAMSLVYYFLGHNANDAWRIAHDRKSWRALRPMAGQAFH